MRSKGDERARFERMRAFVARVAAIENGEVKEIEGS
jgi:hypothetical protein